VLVINDGSSDATKDILPPPGSPIWKNITYCLITIPHAGKGYAVREGLRRARGKWILMADADLSTPFAMYRFLKARARDGAIASRGLKDSIIAVHQPGQRRNLGRLFNCFVRALTGLRFYDTQCGFKLFTKEAAETAGKYITLPGFAFDVEMLMILERAGFQIVEVPVEWSHMEDSRVQAFPDGLSMGLAILKLRFAFLFGIHGASRIHVPRAVGHRPPS
jgi:glycosyltransferase involved in cell wall biosynthesis